MLVKIHGIQNNRQYPEACVVYFEDGNACSVLVTDVFWHEGIPYLSLTKSFDNITGNPVYIIENNSGSITLTKEQEKIYGLL